jgi:hypothetical protein
LLLARLGCSVAKVSAMAEKAVVRARIDGRIKNKAAAVLSAMG